MALHPHPARARRKEQRDPASGQRNDGIDADADQYLDRTEHQRLRRHAAHCRTHELRSLNRPYNSER
jgi:hypothetical protein